MKLYVANGTNQVQSFQFRLPGKKQVQIQPIAIGGQELISGDLTQLHIDSIIVQHYKYGMLPASEIDRGNLSIPYAFSVGKPFTEEQLIRLNRRNQGVLVEVGKEIRKNAAVILGTELGKSARENGAGTLNEVEIDVIEDDQKGTKGDDKFTEKTFVNREGSGRGGQRGRGRR